MSSPIQDVVKKSEILPSSLGTSEDMFILFHKEKCPYCIKMMGEFEKACSDVQNDPGKRKDIRRCEYSVIGEKPYGIKTFPALVRVYKKKDGNFYSIRYDKDSLPRTHRSLSSILTSTRPS